MRWVMYRGAGALVAAVCALNSGGVGARAGETRGGMEAVLAFADRARGNDEKGVVWTVELVSEEGSRTNSRSYRIEARGFDFRATGLGPGRIEGNRLLSSGGAMWFVKPDLSKPVPISRRQRLTGQAANGDIAATDYAHDYAIASVSNGVEQGEECLVFDLKSRTKNATYDRVIYWVAREKRVGIRADYYTASGKRFKTAVMEYGNRLKPETGGERPFISRMVISSAVTDGERTTLSFSDPKHMELPDSTFNLNLLKQ